MKYHGNRNGFQFSYIFWISTGILILFPMIYNWQSQLSRNVFGTLLQRRYSSTLSAYGSTSCFSGNRPYMEDRCISSTDFSFSAVFDGHSSSRISSLLEWRFQEKFMVEICDMKGQSSEKIAAKMADSLVFCDQQLSSIGMGLQEGSAATLLYINKLENNAEFITANIGDCRVVLGKFGKAVDLTIDHHPNNKDERLRIERMGGRVTWDGRIDSDGKPIKSSGCYRINDCLNMSRAIGELISSLVLG